MDYIIERIEGEIGLEEYLSDYRDSETFMDCCKACGNFRKRWHCPPLAPEFEIDFGRYSFVKFAGYKIIPAGAGVIADAHSLLTGPAKRLGNELLKLEHELDGRAMGLAQLDSCLCPEGCTRPSGLPCRHPELVRPALEAYGFDVCKTAREILGVELLWSRDGRLPEYLALVGAVMY